MLEARPAMRVFVRLLLIAACVAMISSCTSTTDVVSNALVDGESLSPATSESDSSIDTGPVDDADPEATVTPTTSGSSTSTERRTVTSVPI